MNDDERMDAFLDALTQRISAKAAGTTPGTNFVHGPGGILSQPGQRAQVVNAMVMPHGLAQRLPAKRSVFANEVYPILTGQTGGTGSNQETPCGDCRQPGNLKICNQTWPFGRLCMDSQVIQLDRMGLLNNRSEFIDQTLVGDPFGQLEPLPGTQWDVKSALRNEKAKQLLQMFVDWRRTFDPLIYTGNPANNTYQNAQMAHGEYNGLDIILNNGYRDTYTGTLCPAADPLIINFGNVDVAADGAATVRIIGEAWADRQYLAKQVGLAPVKHVFVGRYAAFRRLTEIWPCSYYSSRCSLAAGNTNFLNGKDAVELRDEMRKGQYLLIDGQEVEFIEDNTIAETIPVAGVAQSDLYLVPLSSPAFAHNPGGAITYFEFFDMNEPVNIVNAAPGQYPANTFQAMGGGRFLLYPKAPSNVCIQYGMITRDRLIVEAPFLGARITGLRYTFQNHEREWSASAPYYHYDGGGYNVQYPYWYPAN